MPFLEKLRSIKKYKKTVGVVLIVYSFVAFVTPVTPGSWLVFIGLELVGIKLVFLDRFFEKKIPPK